MTAMRPPILLAVGLALAAASAPALAAAQFLSPGAQTWSFISEDGVP